MLQNYKKVLVAVDGSETSGLAFKKAVNIAKQNNAAMLVANVIDTRAFQTVTAFDATLSEQATEMAQDLLMKYQKEALANGISECETLIEYGSPKQTLAKQIPTDYDIDLIIIGATGLNAIERLVIGSVSEYVLRHAITDVLVVRTDVQNKSTE